MRPHATAIAVAAGLLVAASRTNDRLRKDVVASGAGAAVVLAWGTATP